MVSQARAPITEAVTSRQPLTDQQVEEAAAEFLRRLVSRGAAPQAPPPAAPVILGAEELAAMDPVSLGEYAAQMLAYPGRRASHAGQFAGVSPFWSVAD